MSLSDKIYDCTDDPDSFGTSKAVFARDVREAVKELKKELDKTLSDTEIAIIDKIFGEKFV